MSLNSKNFRKLYLFRGILALLIIWYLYKFFLDGIGVFLLPFTLPFFVLAVGLLYISYKKPSTRLKKSIAVGSSLAVLTSLILMLILGFGWRFILSSSLFLQKTPKIDQSNLARCAWLAHVPQDWSCDSSWDGSTRYLTASNPNNNGEYLQLQVEGNKSLKPSCFSVLPVSGLQFASWSALTIPIGCVGSQGFMYKSDWEQDGTHFRLVGRNISVELYLNNLDMYGGNYNQKTDKFTTNHTYKLSPINLKLSQIKSENSSLELSNTNLCKADGTLKEEIKVKFGQDEIPAIVSIKPSGSCILKLDLPLQSLTSGKYKVSTEVNGLKQWLEDEIEITD